MAALAAAETELPPIIVHREAMRVIDGLHRLRVAQVRGQEKIPVRFFDGNDADAFVIAVKSNIAHGLPLTLADRKAAATRILASHPQWSDRMIASVTGLSAGTIGEMRKRLIAIGMNDARIGKDGRVRPLDRSQGRKLALELMAINPRLSLRQIARAAGISTETARDVRSKLHRGEDPIAQGRAAGRASQGEKRNGHRGKSGEPELASALCQDRAAVVARLKADPALRLTETGRSLLGMFHIQAINAEQWDKIIINLPPHCRNIVAHLARQYARAWAEFADRVEQYLCS